MWKYLAHLILALHAVCSVFVLVMPWIVPLGIWLAWPWVRDPWLRQIHVGIVLFIAIEVVMGRPCPLTVWENGCRIRAEMPPLYTTGFFDYWVENLLKISFKDWMFESIFFTVGVATIAEYFLLGPLR